MSIDGEWVKVLVSFFLKLCYQIVLVTVPTLSATSTKLATMKNLFFTEFLTKSFVGFFPILIFGFMFLTEVLDVGPDGPKSFVEVDSVFKNENQSIFVVQKFLHKEVTKKFAWNLIKNCVQRFPKVVETVRQKNKVTGGVALYI